MILASASPVSLGLAAAAALAYAVPALAARALGAAGARRVLLLAWLLHGAQLAWGVLGSEPRFGFAPALSITVWLVLTVYAIESQLYPQMTARWALAGFGTLAILLALLFPGAHPPATGSPLLPLHWALGIAAYGLLAAAVAHGWLMQRAEDQMRHATQTVDGGVPLLTLERLMFRFLGAGFVLLTLTMLAGALFGEQLYGASYTGWRWDHKRVFTLLSWLTFGTLLAGRWWFGWRGRRAVRVLYIGAALLLLGYVGSRFVLEVLLGRVA
ncbi:MAG TPA: cytochrome c biogenesis protein CcsA [Ottowia sp.]|uniref:cytochrome C assembly family protein n=1 Tax=Ottowia sp. TaxID=1898956 RepID=UPI0011D60748|nr:cytochrome c biogenesis protein CcsA [Ottowia sp.]TXI16449.1 MAG: cytochrome C assembly protein [Ottowia sp.]HNR83695.1 cytochrome c biogenesis protein CcsA [Ottowia sp.]HNT85849.1 cytochrome c biogenesis protein CcsA [Ottowia sp.]HOZ92790.1 cytochrome c biogenesis protein CcsA [Ottowia sp.]HQO53526.1 cytochrome c biogenesis protein CcsA [Ottowia sp.]